MIISGAALIAASLLGAHLLPTTLTLLAALGLCVLAAKSIPGRTHGPALARPVLPPRIHVASWRDFLPLTISEHNRLPLQSRRICPVNDWYPG